jgi:putative transposase
VSRKQQGSANREQASKRLARGYLKVQRQRKAVASKHAKALVQSHELVACEDVKIGNLVKKHQLAKSIQDVAWGILLAWVRDSGGMHARPVVAVPPHFTTQECSGVLPDGAPCPEGVQKWLSVRTPRCPRGGLVLDRDENAARNRVELALRTAGQAGTGSCEAANASGQTATTRAARTGTRHSGWLNEASPG